MCAGVGVCPQSLTRVRAVIEAKIPGALLKFYGPPCCICGPGVVAIKQFVRSDKTKISDVAVQHNL
jgi:hypothetical protein